MFRKERTIFSIYFQCFKCYFDVNWLTLPSSAWCMACLSHLWLNLYTWTPIILAAVAHAPIISSFQGILRWKTERMALVKAEFHSKPQSLNHTLVFCSMMLQPRNAFTFIWLPPFMAFGLNAFHRRSTSILAPFVRCLGCRTAFLVRKLVLHQALLCSLEHQLSDQEGRWLHLRWKRLDMKATLVGPSCTV